MVIGESVIHDAIQFLCRFRTLSTPPKPFPFSFVQRAKQHRHFRRLELLQLNGDGVDVLDEKRVVCIRGISKRIRDVEVCGSGIEARPPSLSFVVIKADGASPVPDKRNDSALGGEVNGFVYIRGGSTTGYARLGVVWGKVNYI